MTLKQIFIRYLKEKGYYGTMLNFVAYNYSIGMGHSRRFFAKATANDLFNMTCNMYRVIREYWPYENKTLYDFINDWCINKTRCNIKRGDTITVKTLDKKYEFDYVVLDVWFTRMEVQLLSGGFMSLERICKVNGKPYDIVNGWEFRKDLSHILKVHK